jgi:hypothetical protein
MNVRTRFAWRKQDSDAAVEIVVNICHIYAVKLKKVGHIRQTCLSVFRRIVVKKSIEGFVSSIGFSFQVQIAICSYIDVNAFRRSNVTKSLCLLIEAIALLGRIVCLD